MLALATTPLRFRAALAGCGVGVGSYALAALNLAPGADLARHVGWFLLSFLFYLIAVGLVLRAEPAHRKRGTPAVELILVLGVALLLRGALLATTPSLSDDVFRYVWDGKVVNADINPYLYAPAAPELRLLRGPLWEGINHKAMPTPYPPAAEALFAGAYRLVPDSLTVMQAMAVAFDLGIVVLLLLMLARAGLGPLRVLIYAWNPLVLVQFGHSAHYDGAMILPLLGAIYLIALRRRVASGMLLGLSTLLKLVPAAAAPLFLPFWGVGGLAAAGVVTAAGLIPWLAAGTALGGVASEAAEARFNDSLSYLITRLLGLILPNPDVAARAVAMALLAGGALLLAGKLGLRRAGWTDLLRATYRVLGLFLLLNAVVEPWYLTWMAPFLCFFLSSGPRGLPRLEPALGWLLLTGLVVLTDLTYLPQVESSAWVWVRAAEYGPLYGLLMLSLWRYARRAPRTQDSGLRTD